MTNPEIKKSPRSLFGWAGVVGGILLFLAGLGLRLYLPGSIADTRLLEGLGILLIGWGVIPLVQTIKSLINPLSARRERLAESDERATILRNQAGFDAFLFAIVANSILLVVYSAFTRGQTGFDPIWLGLVVLVVSPIIVFSVTLLWLNRTR
jgi:hypothetical protein